MSKLNKEELQFIRDNSLSMTDEEMAKHLKRARNTVKKARLRIGIHKTGRGKISGIFTGDPAQDQHTKMVASQKLNERQRQEFFRAQLTNSLYYKVLKEQFTKEELDFYLEAWGSLCVQFEDIVITEKHQIDELIKTMIYGNRTGRNIKIVEMEIEKLQKAAKKLGDIKGIEEDVELQEKYDNLRELIRMCAAESSAMHRDYEKNQDMKNKLLGELNARRKDRIDHLTKAGTTFMGLVSAFKEREVRENHGRYLELIRLSKEKKKSDFRKESVFPAAAGKDCILLDDQCDYVTKNKNPQVSGYDDLILGYITDVNKKKILLLENDDFRIQFFQTAFKNHEINYASNVEKAIKLLDENKYDLVCIDYDVGLEEKGNVLAKLIKDRDLECDVLVHSENEKGVELIRQILRGKDNVRFIRFKEFMEKVSKDAESSVS